MQTPAGYFPSIDLLYDLLELQQNPEQKSSVFEHFSDGYEDRLHTWLFWSFNLILC